MTTPALRAAPTAATLLVLVLALVAGACSGEDAADGQAPSAAPTPAPSGAPAVETVVTFGRITGKLPGDNRKRVAAQVGDVVDRWAEAAYLGGDYPRRDFSDSWPGFTAGARAQAHQDRALMSNDDIGQKIDGVEVRHRRVRIDVLAAKRHAVGVTARVTLGFRTTGRVRRDVRVQGRLYLTRTQHGWQVFGYDVTKGAI